AHPQAIALTAATSSSNRLVHFYQSSGSTAILADKPLKLAHVPDGLIARGHFRLGSNCRQPSACLPAGSDAMPFTVSLFITPMAGFYPLYVP
ncbi:hypothetical protein, partial [Mesorhizobium sp. A623]